MKRFAFASIVTLFAPACEGDSRVAHSGPKIERDGLELAARQLLGLHNGHDELAEKFSTPGRAKSSKKRATALVERMEWFRAAVGFCSDYQLYRSFGPKRARFVFHCERGQLEALIGVDDDGRVNELRTGARGVAPPERVWVAAERWLESPDAEVKAEGCRLNRVHLGSVSGALFVLSCPEGEKTLIIDKLDRDGEPRRVVVIDHAMDEWRMPADVG